MRHGDRSFAPLSRTLPRGPRRALVLYLVAIVVPTLLLLFLGLQMLRRQQDAVERFARANGVLAEQMVADALESRVGEEASACLRDSRLAAVAGAASWTTPRAVRTTRLALQEIVRVYPVAAHLFVVEDGEVRVPRVGSTWPRSVADLLLDEPTALAEQLRVAFAAAAGLEQTDRYDDACAAYRRAGARCRTAAVAAYALARAADCLAHAGRTVEAVVAYEELASRFEQEYALSGRPYALDAAAEIARLQPAGTDYELILIYAKLKNGVWDVSPDEAAHFLASSPPTVRVNKTSYIRYLESSRALSETVHASPLAMDGLVHGMPAIGADGNRQFYYLARPDVRPVVLEVDLDHVRAALLPSVIKHLQSAPSRGAGGSGRGAAVGTADASIFQMMRLDDIQLTENVGTAFRTAFPFWRVHAAPFSGRGPSTALVALATLLVLAVLVLSVVLLLRDTARQSATNRLRADLVGAVSHDLKTPLSVIRLYGETLARDPDADRQARSSYYDIIVHESERLTALIDRVLDFSRIEGSVRHYQLQVGNLVDVVAPLVERYRPHLEERGFVVDTEFGADVPPVRFDEGAVSQAVLNLIDNAAKYSDEDRRIVVRVLRRGGDAAVVEVEDHGVGIAEIDRNRIFARFSRGSRPTARGSHGLGLYLVKHMADAHAAQVELKSTVGRGTIFSLVFPPAAIADAQVT